MRMTLMSESVVPVSQDPRSKVSQVARSVGRPGYPNRYLGALPVTLRLLQRFHR